MKVLVTGADGFIGSHLTEALVRGGHDVRAFVYYNSFNSWGWLDRCAPDVKGRFDVFAGDIRDPHGVRTAMRGCDRVLHLAALIAIPYSYPSPDTYVDTNIKGTLNVVQAAREPRRGARRAHLDERSLRHGALRADQRGAPVAGPVALLGQQDRRGPDRAVVPLLLRTPVAVLRPFNTYGPRQSARAVIPTIITQIAGGRASYKLGAAAPDARLQVRRGHARRLPARGGQRRGRRRGHQHRQRLRDHHRRPGAADRRADGRGRAGRDQDGAALRPRASEVDAL